ncbi:MAG: diguanylate cyclase [Calditerrivibrio sp.]|nr:diguanylate cyclase [Calditerrivibrio sp.]
MVISEDILKTILDSSLDGICAVDKNFTVVHYNKAFVEGIRYLYGIDIEKGVSLNEIILGVDKEKWRKCFVKAFNGLSLKRLFSVRVNNSSFTILVKFFPLRSVSNEIIGAVAIARNVTKEKKKQRLLKQNLAEQYVINEVFKSLFNPKDFTKAVNKVLSIIGHHTSLSVIYVYEDYFDRDYCHLSYLWTNKPDHIEKYRKEFSYSNYEGFKKTIVDNGVLMYNQYAIHLEKIERFFKEHEAKSSIIFPMMIKGEYIGFIGFEQLENDRFLTVSEIDVLRIFASILSNALIQKYTEDKLTYASTHDPLTGLYNRAFFDAELERVIHGRVFPVGIIVADLNGLKQINDTLGHKAGDELIIKASQVLMKVFRKEDCVARIGGDEFAIILPKVDEAMMMHAIDRIRQVEKELNSSGGPQVSFALGGYTATNKDEIHQALIKADELMYQDKKRIKGSFKG